MLVEAILFVAVALGIAFIVYSYAIYKPSYVSGLMNLNSEKECLSMDSKSGFGAWNSTTPCTLRFFVFLHSVNRTSEALTCDSNPPLLPGCGDYDGVARPCQTISCSTENTVFSNSYLKTIFKTGGKELEFMIHGSINQNRVPAYLKIMTNHVLESSDAKKVFLEGISLPAVPLQAWTMITITKDGKRVDVFYNGKRVASKVLQYPPIDLGLGNKYYCGNASSAGSIGYTNWSKGAQTQEEVANEYSNLTNTKGVPREINALSLKFGPPPSLEAPCLLGTCNPMPSVAPANPFTIWEARAY